MIELLNIEEFAETKAGGTPSTKVPEYWENGNIPWLNSGALNQGIVKSTSKFITKLGLEKSSAKLMPPDTVLIALTGATTGVAGYLTFEACANQSVVGILPSKRHFPKYLYYYLILIRQKVLKDASGAAQPGVNQKYVKNIQIPIPPLDEQKRIVAILDKCFEAIDKARANVEKNLRKTEELHQSLLFQILYQDSEKWEKSILGESCEFFNGKAHEKAIHTDGSYVVVNSKFISRDGKIKKYTREQMFPLFKNDIVMVMSDVPNGKALAKCYLIEKDNTYSLNQRICAIRSENYIHKYLFYQLNRHRHLLSFNNGENQTNLRKNDILNTPLYIPPFDDQEEVVKKLDEVVSQTKSLKSNYQQELDALDELKKSILQKAFNGEL